MMYVCSIERSIVRNDSRFKLFKRCTKIKSANSSTNLVSSVFVKNFVLISSFIAYQHPTTLITNAFFSLYSQRMANPKCLTTIYSYTTTSGKRLGHEPIVRLAGTA